MMDPTEDQIDTVLAALQEEGFQPPYGASARNYVSAESRGEERVRQLAALKAADNEAEAKNREAVRQALRRLGN